MFLTRLQRLAKLRTLAELEGFPSINELVAASVDDAGNQIDTDFVFVPGP